jgi:predicted porin
VKTSFYQASLALALLASAPITACAGDDVKVLLELLLEKGIITQEEFDQKLKVAREKEEIRAFNEAQDIRRANREIDKRAEDERKFKTQIYGQVSAGYYQASNMTSANLDASGMSDQPKGNNRVGLKVSRELDADTTAMITLESNFSARTGAVGRDAAATGSGVNPLFDREANVRLISKVYGTLIIGRGPNLQTDLSGAFDARSNWNFGGLKPIARYAGFHSASGINRADRLIRYISPSMNGFHADIGLAPGGVPGDVDQATNIYLGGRYKNGPFELGYNHIEARVAGAGVTTQAGVNNRVDFFAAKYTFEQLTLNAGYVITRNPTNPAAVLSTSSPNGQADVDTFFSGALYRLTPQLSVNGGYYTVKDKRQGGNGVNDVTMIATGLTWSPYKEWDLFVDYVMADRKNGATAAFTIYDSWRPDSGFAVTKPHSAGTRDQSGISVGAQYKF